MEPSQRLTCGELLAHAYFDDYEPMKAPAVKTRKTRVCIDCYSIIRSKTRISRFSTWVCTCNSITR